jgi:MerR family redox-sensitive transcriptional activator SoxR
MPRRSDEGMTIGEVAQRVGLHTSTLRYYESIGLLPPPKRISGQRRYSTDVLQVLAVIQLAKEANFTLDEIHTLLNDSSAQTTPSERWKALAQRKLHEVELVIAQAQAMKHLLEAAIECEYLLLELDESVLARQENQP